MRILKNIFAIILGVIVGGFVNMGIVMLGPSLIAPPTGVDVNDMESIKANMHLYEMKHFIMPFLAHAIGTLVGGLVAAKVAASHKMRIAMIIGIFFLIGGIMMVMMLPSPIWFNVLDLGFAYLPMAYLGYKIGS